VKEKLTNKYYLQTSREHTLVSNCAASISSDAQATVLRQGFFGAILW
jgi:hypothetical protein